MNIGREDRHHDGLEVLIPKYWEETPISSVVINSTMYGALVTLGGIPDGRGVHFKADEEWVSLSPRGLWTEIYVLPFDGQPLKTDGFEAVCQYVEDAYGLLDYLHRITE